MINSAAIAKTLRPGLAAVFGDYSTYQDEWKEIFSVHKSNMGYEEELEMKYLGTADFMDEGQPVSTDSMGQRISTIYRHKRVGLSFVITKIAQDDQLYNRDFPQQAKSLRTALRNTKNILGANILNNGFNTAYATGDGQPVFSLNHPIDGGVFANTFAVNTDFSEAGVEAALIKIQEFPMQSGILCNTKAKKLMVPRGLQFAASRLLNNSLRTDTANRDISAIYHGDYIPEGYVVNNFLNTTSDWFIKTDSDNGFKHYVRTGVETGADIDFPTDNITFKATERYSFGISNVRACFGAQGI